MFLDKIIELFLEKDVFWVDVGVYKTEASIVVLVLEGCADDLEHGRNSCAACDHANLAREGGSVLELALGTLDADGVANFE